MQKRFKYVFNDFISQMLICLIDFLNIKRLPRFLVASLNKYPPLPVDRFF